MSYEIKDSGNRTEFSTGSVRDMHEGKGDFSLLPWEAIWEVAKHCEKGAVKYGKYNVNRGLPISSLIDSAFRHLAKYMMGWDDEPHLVAAAWNVLFAIWMEQKKPEMQDIPARKPKIDLSFLREAKLDLSFPRKANNDAEEDGGEQCSPLRERLKTGEKIEW